MQNRQSSPRGVRSPWHLAPLAVAVALCACNATTPVNNEHGSAALSTQQNIFGLQLPGATPTATPAGSATPATQAIAALAPAQARPVAPIAAHGRTVNGMTALFIKGSVNGEELLGELRAVRETLRAQRTASAMTSLMGTVNTVSAESLQNTQVQDRLVSLALNALSELVKQYAVSLSFQALDRHLQTVLDNPGALRAETVRLPNPNGLDETQMRRALVMASLVVTARVTGKMLKAADGDFKGIESGYADLIGKREKAATLLYEVIGRGDAARGELARAVAPAELEFARRSAASMSVKDFSQDLGAQNVALTYLQRQDPKAFADYKAQADKLLPAAQGYLRTVSGGVAFASMMVMFAQEVTAIARGKKAPEIVAMLPLAYEFAVEAPTLVPVAVKALGSGVSLPFQPERSFRVGNPAEGFEELASANDVFAELRKRGAEPTFQQGIFRRDTSGLLHRLYLCSPVEAGRLLDTALKAPDRERFAADYLQAERPGFSFANLFEQPVAQLGARERTLGDELLRSDYRQRADARRLPFGDLQKKLSDEGGYRAWTDDQLLRLIFVNREGQARHAELQLGVLSVRPVASARTVFVYESLVDGCRRVLDPESKHPKTSPKGKPAPKPASATVGKA
jgi:hypothetical protein